jgi:hypothetical protein
LILNLSIEADRKRAGAYLSKLTDDGSVIELKKIAKKRSLSQNSYVHALFSLFGGHFGYNIEESKQVVKQRLGYTYIKDGVEFLSQTSKMNTKEKTVFIEKFRNLSSHEGCYLPTPEEFSDNYVEMMKQVESIESQMNRYSY